MNILVVTGTYPTKSEIKEAADVVSYCISEELSKKHQLDLQVINFKDSFLWENKVPKDTSFIFRKINPTIKISNDTLLIKLFKKTLTKNSLIKYEKKQFKGYLKKLNSKKYDVILTIWTEIGTKIVSVLPNPKFAYYGNLESEVRKSNTFLNVTLKKNFKNIIKLILWKIFENKEKNLYFYYLSKYKHIFNVSLIDAKKIASSGISSSYLQMTWDQGQLTEINRQTTQDNKTKFRVCCSVGRLSNTGNTFGFLTLINEIIPEIKKRNLVNFFKLQIYGAGEFREKYIKDKLIENNIEIMGFVKDLEYELKNSLISIIPHNRLIHKVSHTRVLHNWKIGIPLVLFSESSLAMPELKHKYNCLLANDASEFVSNMLELTTNSSLRSFLIANGRNTLKKEFNSVKVSEEIESKFILK